MMSFTAVVLFTPSNSIKIDTNLPARVCTMCTLCTPVMAASRIEVIPCSLPDSVGYLISQLSAKVNQAWICKTVK